jgi:hypothetical protein
MFAALSAIVPVVKVNSNREAKVRPDMSYLNSVVS